MIAIGIYKADYGLNHVEYISYILKDKSPKKSKQVVIFMKDDIFGSIVFIKISWFKLYNMLIYHVFYI